MTFHTGLAAVIDQMFGGADGPRTLGVAVSGGGDSMALLHLLAEWGKCTLAVATVDHGLRPEAAGEAARVARECARLGLSHDSLTWRGWTGAGNLQGQARSARYRLLAEWGGSRGLDAVALGHTADDQAETFLMRIARESGVDGLSAMRAAFDRDGMRFCRPLLAVRRQQLRDYLQARGLCWVEDRSNDDLRFDRVKARAAMAALQPLGISAGTIGRVAENLGRTRAALDAMAGRAAEHCVRQEAGDVVFDFKALAEQDSEIRRRLLIWSLRWVAGAGYGPRAKALQRAWEQLVNGSGTTLHGCAMLHKGADLRVTRELRSVAGLRGATDQPWDGRWRMTGPHGQGLQVAALTADGLSACPDWRATGLPRTTLVASAAVWRGAQLVSAPTAGLANGWSADLAQSFADFRESLISH